VLKGGANMKKSDITITFLCFGVFILLVVGCVARSHPSIDAKTYFNLGLTNYDKGEYDRAIHNYTEAIKINPKYAMCFNSRGNAYFMKGQYDKAISDYDKAIKINSNYAAAFYNRGMVYYKKGLYEEAWDDVMEAQFLGSSIDPNFIESLCEDMTIGR
jgi:tetratricopeptide (TPR) repeat protein